MASAKCVVADEESCNAVLWIDVQQSSEAALRELSMALEVRCKTRVSERCRVAMITTQLTIHLFLAKITVPAAFKRN